MDGLNATDAQLLQIVTAAPPATIADVLAILQNIDNTLRSNDGLKWFNLLYLKVTENVDTQPPPNGWEDQAWLTLLDVVFAKLYFATIAEVLSQSANAPSSWLALFEARNRPNIDRIQFALSPSWRETRLANWLRTLGRLVACWQDGMCAKPATWLGILPTTYERCLAHSTTWPWRCRTRSPA